MAEKAMFIDTSLCMGCRGCQIACKQWWQQGVTETTQTGTYQNPPDLDWQTWSLLRFSETEIDGKFHWLFAKDQCRHCADPMPCALGCPNDAISKNEHGAVLIDQEKCGECELQCAQYCPYDVPKPEIGAEGETFCRVFKCRMCTDRLEAGKTPACAKTCSTGAIHFGDKADMVALAESRLTAVQGDYPMAEIYPGTEGNAFWLILAGNDEYMLSSYKEHPGLERRDTPAPMLAATELIRNPAVIAGGTFFGAMETLRYRKNKLAEVDED
jgi:formate dehydrogenase iron-sulfur subunit